MQKTPITWDQSDHTDNIPEPGAHALIVSPVVQNHRLRRVMMDGGACIHIMYLSTLEKLHLSKHSSGTAMSDFTELCLEDKHYL